MIELLKKKFENIDDIPEFPRYKSKEEYQDIIEKYLEFGAIAKKDLILGGWYIGQSRNTGIAQWVGDKFIFIRHKMDGRYIDSINHFEDDYNYDLFIPFKLVFEA
jgi:hypothetical protein